MSGKLIIVSGYSGAGKSTLIRGAIDSIGELEYLKTVVTRPIRVGESDSIEYDFVSDDEYEKRRQAAVMWDHVEHQGFKYGVDVDWVVRTLRSGTNLICAIAPETGIYQKLKKLYGKDPLTIWVDTSEGVSGSRISGDSLRSERDENDELKDVFGHVFEPSGNLQLDTAAFRSIVQDIL